MQRGMSASLGGQARGLTEVKEPLAERGEAQKTIKNNEEGDIARVGSCARSGPEDRFSVHPGREGPPGLACLVAPFCREMPLPSP